MPEPLSPTADQLLEQAHLCLVRRDFAGARRLADQVLAMRPDDRDAALIWQAARAGGRPARRRPSPRALGVLRGTCAAIGVACAIGVVLLFPSTGRYREYEGAGPVVHGLHRAEWKLVGCMGLGIVGLVAFVGAGGIDPDWRDLDKTTDTRTARAFLSLWWW